MVETISMTNRGTIHKYTDYESFLDLIEKVR